MGFIIRAMQAYGIGLVGWGTVGGGVIEILNRDADLFRERCGLDIQLRTVVTRDPSRVRDQELTDVTLTDDLSVLLADDHIQCVLHLVGGTDVAKTIAIECLRAGKHVVTANKALVAEHGDELFQVAQDSKSTIAYEAAVAGSIPVIAALRDGLVANRIGAIQGILNGTCNYILTQMEERGWSYDEALTEAKRLGYAEADPTLDVDGTDTAHKLAILARIAFMDRIPFDSVDVEGIEAITATDIASAKRMGCRIKLLGVAERQDNGLALRVAPTLVPIDFPLAAVSANYNAVRIDANSAGPTLLVGQGAGALPTASAVLADMVDIATGRYAHTVEQFSFYAADAPARIIPELDVQTASYARFTVIDQTGTLAVVADHLNQAGVSILSLFQGRPNAEGIAVVEVTTHPCESGAFLKAIEEIDALEQVRAPTVVLRMLAADPA